jgi:hypothetical protein
MSVPAYVYDFFTYGYKTATAATAITLQIDGKNGKRLALIDLRYTCAATAHLLSLMYAKDAAAYPGSSRNVSSALAAISQAHIIVTTAPRDPAGNAAAANDVVAYQVSDGTWEWNTIASISGSDITLNTNLAKACPAGAKVLILGVVGDLARFDLAAVASVQNKYGEGRICIVHPYTGEPFYFYSPNGTNAGSLDNICMGYINK